MATWLSPVLAVLVCRRCIVAWCHGWWSRLGRIYYTLAAPAALAGLPLVVSGDLARPTG